MKSNNNIKSSNINSSNKINISNDDFDSIFENYVNKIEIPKVVEVNIFNKIDNNTKNFKKSVKSMLGILFFNFPSATNTHATNFLIVSFTSMLTILSPYKFSNNDEFKLTKDIQEVYSLKKENVINIDKPDRYRNFENKNFVDYQFKDTFAIENYSELKLIGNSPFSININSNYLVNYNAEFENINMVHQSPVIFKNQNFEPFNFELKYSSFNNLRYDESNYNNEAVLLNYSFGLWYPVKYNLLIGGEFRQERITLTKDNNLNTKILNCWEAGIKYFPNMEIANLQPYLQFNLGANSSGLVSRAGIGLTLEIENNFNIFLGTELNSLIYLNNKKINSTERVGVNFGINLILK